MSHLAALLLISSPEQPHIADSVYLVHFYLDLSNLPGSQKGWGSPVMETILITGSALEYGAINFLLFSADTLPNWQLSPQKRNGLPNSWCKWWGDELIIPHKWERGSRLLTGYHQLEQLNGFSEGEHQPQLKEDKLNVGRGKGQDMEETWGLGEQSSGSWSHLTVPIESSYYSPVPPPQGNWRLYCHGSVERSPNALCCPELEHAPHLLCLPSPSADSTKTIC